MLFSLFLVSGLWSLVSGPAIAQSQFSTTQRFLKQKGINSQTTAVYAVWADTGEPVAAYQEKMPLLPASSLKILTAYCALKKLGPTYTFQTDYLSDGPLQNGSIQNLWVKGEGDPSLVIEKLWADVQDLKKLGLKKIGGNIYVDASYFDARDYPGRQENNKRAYNAPTSALSLNYNTIVVNPQPKPIYRSVKEADLFFGNALKELLKESGIPVIGEVRRGRADGKQLLYNAQSKPLYAIVQDMNKFSNNFIAEQIVKHIGAKTAGAPGTTAKGMAVIRECLQEIGGGKERGTFIENGSGLSYKNKISAQDLVKVLLAASHDFKIQPEFISSLSVAGLDGTMRKRRVPKELLGEVRAKTGSLDGATSIAGFVPSQEGRPIAFSILMNNYRGGHEQGLRVQEGLILEWRHLKR